MRLALMDNMEEIGTYGLRSALMEKKCRFMAEIGTSWMMKSAVFMGKIIPAGSWYLYLITV